MAPAVGTVLQGRYRIDGPAGSGGMSAVYRATDLRLDATVAVKQRLGAAGMLGGAFEQEARLLAALRHPVLPKVTDYFVADGEQYLIMEFVAGDDLAMLQVRERQPFPLDQVLVWADQILDALAYLHGNDPPIFHRDIKPANLKPAAQGRIALLDFGLAKRQHGAEASLAGYTLTFAPPEQVQGEETTGRSDLYSLAATLHDLLSGKPFPDARQRLAAAEAGQADPLWPLHELNAAAPTGVSLVLHQALALDPELRPASAEEMRELLRRASGEQATRHLPTPGGIAGRSEVAGNLPSWLAPLIGRQREITALQHLLGEEEVRLVTLTGPGGTGKTRLALAAAGITERYRDGVWFVDLAPIADPSLVASTIANTLGVRERGAAPVQDALREYLRARQVLLVLDNFEQVLEAAPLVVTLLTSCPHLQVLATSREPLRLRGEREYPVSPLPLADAVALFSERARAVQPEFTISGELEPVISAICARLDGLPLAIELAAARIRLLPPGAMLARLERRLQVVGSGPRDLPARQQTLRRTIDWSHDLLTPQEQKLFARLAVFVGGCTLEAAEVIGSWGDRVIGETRDPNTPTPHEPITLDLVASLVGKSLLRQVEGADGEPRLMMLETINEYARERLEASGEAEALRRAHASYALALAEEAYGELTGPRQAQWLARLEEEHDNLRAAMSWAREVGESEFWLRLAWSLWRFWELRFRLREGRQWLEGALAADDGSNPVARARALNGAGDLAWAQGDLIPAAAYLRESIPLFRSSSDHLGTTRAVNDLANVVSDQGDYAGAVALYEESLGISREIGAAWEIACALHNLGLMAKLLDDPERAQALLAESLPRWKEIGDEVALARSLDAAGEVAQRQGDAERALAYHTESLAMRRRLGDLRGVALSITNLAWTALLRDEPQQAWTLFQESIPLHHDAGNYRSISGCLVGLATLSVAEGRSEEAAHLLGAADALDRADGAARSRALQDSYEQTMSIVAAVLTTQALTAALDAGRALSQGQAVSLALAAG